MKMLAVKVMIRHGHQIIYIAPAADAHQTVDNWASCYYKTKGIKVLQGRCAGTGMNWAVLEEDITGIHTAEMESTPPAQGFGPGRLYPGTSGIN